MSENRHRNEHWSVKLTGQVKIQKEKKKKKKNRKLKLHGLIGGPLYKYKGFNRKMS